jgi:hypothetical protein
MVPGSMPFRAAAPLRARHAFTAARVAALNLLLPALLAWQLAGPLYRYCYPRVADHAPKGDDFGAISLKLQLSGTNAGIPEPLIVCGVPGRASLVYIRVLRKDRALMGIEFWGKKAVEGAPFALPPDGRISVVCSLPAYFPAEGDRHWRGASAARQKQRCTEYEVAVDDVVRLSGPIDYPQPSHSPLYFGVNAVGGSWVSSRFTGAVLKVSQSL